MFSYKQKGKRAVFASPAAFIDVKAAYDNVDHNTLIRILKLISCPMKITRYVINWIKNRKIYVQRSYNETLEMDMIKGLPQGFIISPLLYNIYTHEIDKVLASPSMWVLQYADDIAILTKGPNMQENKHNIQKGILNIVNNLQ